MTRILVWFLLGLFALCTYFVAALSDWPFAVIWPLMAFVAITIGLLLAAQEHPHE